MATNNSTIMAKAWLAGTNDFQQRIPQPTQESMDSTIEALFEPMNQQYYNQFMDMLINRIGRTYVRGQRWENRLRAFKNDSMRYGNTIQEIAVKWITAHSYQDDAETLLKLNRPEAQAWYHSVNRQDKYPISISEIELRRAFTEEYGLNDLIAKIMQVPYNSDSYDEYIAMRQLIAMYDNKWGFFKVNLSAAPTTEATAKELLVKVRTYAEKLGFPSSLYNAAPITDIPVFADPSELVILTTPEVKANLDVQALAGVFNLDKADIQQHMVVIDEFPIAGAQMLLTTRDWFVVNDVVYTTTSFYNPETLTTNYWLHHHEIISCSPFVPAILFTTAAATTPSTYTMAPSGITLAAAGSASTVSAGGTLQLIPALTGTITSNDEGIEVRPDGATYTITCTRTTTSGDSSVTTDVQLNSRTYVDRNDVLHVQKGGLQAGDVIKIVAHSIYINPGGSTTAYDSSALSLTVA